MMASVFVSKEINGVPFFIKTSAPESVRDIIKDWYESKRQINCKEAI